MRIAHQPRSLPRRQIVHRLIGHHRCRHIQERHIDLLALTGPPTLHQGCQNRRRSINAGEHIRYRHTHLLRLPIRRAGHAHQPGHALNDEIIPGAVCIRPVLPEPGDRTIDQPRVHLP
jgi:hypothetical protein